MSDKLHIFDNAISVDKNELQAPITQVTLLVGQDEEGNDIVYVAGNTENGINLDVSLPWGTQELADQILAKVSGVKYQPFQVSGACIDPALEVGDAVEVNGFYGIMGNVTIRASGVVDIDTPGGEDIENEIPYGSGELDKIVRKLSSTMATFAVAFDSISSRVEDVEGGFSEVTQTVDEITSKVQDLEGNVSTVTQTVDGLTVTVGGGSTMIRGDRIDTNTLNLTGMITFTDLSSGLQNDINGAVSDAQDAVDTVNSWRYQGTTLIDGTSIMTGTVTASKLRGGEVALLDADGVESATLSLTGASSYDGRKIVIDSGAVEIKSGYGDVFLSASNAYLQLSRQSSTIQMVADEILFNGKSIVDVVYPKGSVYMSANPTSPSDLFGGTWQSLPGRFLLGAGSGYSAGSAGGESEHTLTVNEMPSHTHTTTTNIDAAGFGTNNSLARGYGGSTENKSGSPWISHTGGGQAHNNMPPYLVVYMWKRTG